MRKKLLSLLTVLCLVLGMLPATAMAIDTANIDKTDEANVQVIAEDTELTGTIEKLVLVDAAVKVDVTDATLTVGLVVSPDAEGAEVTISGTTAAEVVVLANASVKTDAATTVETVTVDAAEATVEVAGEVASVVLTENAQGVSLTVAETATVAAVEVAAPNATVAVAGTVESVTVAETATGAELAVAETATVTTVTDATGELTVSGAGAESVTVENTAEPAEGEDEDAKDEETEGSEEDAKGEENTETPDAGMDVPFVPPVDPDEGGDSEEPEEPEQPEQPGSAPKITWGNVECAAGESVDVTASAVEAKDAGYWVKFSIANPDAEKYEMVVKVNNTEVTLDSNFYWFDVTSLVTAATTEAVEQFIADETKVEYKEDTENPENSAWSIKEGVTAPASVKVESQTPTTVTVTLTEKTTEENPNDVTKEADGEYTYTFELSVDATVEKDLTEDVNTALAEKKAPDPAPGADE